MKGHVGGGPGSDNFKVSVARVTKLVVPWPQASACGQACPIHVSIRKYDIVQERLLENERFIVGTIPPDFGSDIKLESLILAQNERWRHA